MANLSLARIMYGTNDDLHSTTAVRAPSFSPLLTQAASGNLADPGNATKPAPFSSLLQKAWSTLTSKY
jgi:hypothetical protein